MDILGSYGYSGQPLVYLDADKFCFISGCGIVIVDQSGPKDIIWRHENGVNTITTNTMQKWLAIAPKVAKLPIEILDISLQKVLFSIKNPTDATITTMSFCKDAARLVALSDISDHKVILWNVSTRTVLHVYTLTEHVRKCAFNPGNINMISLHDEEYISVGVYNELLGIYDLKLTKTEIIKESDVVNESVVEDSKVKRQLLDILPISYTNPIGFMCWSSLETMLVGTTQGYYFDVNISTKTSTLIAHGHSQPGDSAPTSAVLTADFLVVGSTDGTVKWFPRKLITAFLIRAASGHPLEHSYFRPIKIAKLQRIKTNLRSLCCMSANPLYSSISCGSMDGTIHLLSLELQENAQIEEEDVPDSDDPVTALLASLPPIPELIVVEPFVDMQVGAALCCRSLYIQVMQTQDGIPINEYAGSLSLLITGSHTGSVMFWRTPVASEFDFSEGNEGIRKSVPHSPRPMLRHSIASNDFTTAAVTQLEIMSAVAKHGGRLLAVGTSDGWLEIWLIEAFESEDEDGEGDEEEGLFYLKVSCVLRRHMLMDPITLISPCEFKPMVAIGSTLSNEMYVLAFHSTSELVQICSSFSVVADGMNSELVGLPKACCWQKSTLWIVTSTGMLISIKDISDKAGLDAPPANIGYIATSISTVGLGLIGPTGLYLLPNEISNRIMISATLPATEASHESTSAASNDFFPYFIDHSTNVICIARSLQGPLVATGCSDGSITLWRVEGKGSSVTHSLYNKYRVHSSAVLSLEFSVDSSLLMSCSADGSVFVTNVEKLHVLKKDPRVPSLKLPDDIIRDTITYEEDTVPNPRLWLEIQKDNIIVSLRHKYASSIEGVSNSLGYLKEKLQKMLTHNAICDEMERLDASEFVIDVIGKDQLVMSNESQVQAVRKHYQDEGMRNDLIAARVRQAFWDCNEIQSKCILPMQSDLASTLAIWSFPIKKYTEMDLTRLDRVKRLRALEMRAQIKHGGGIIQLVKPSGSTRSAWITAIEGSPVDITWLVNDGARWPRSDIEALLLGKEDVEMTDKKGTAGKDGTTASLNADDEDETSIAENDVTEYDVDFNNVFNLLYPPQAVRTQIQKRGQIMLLKDVCRKIRWHFNERFEELCREKDDVIAQVETRNVRILEILAELQLQEEVPSPRLEDSEIPSSAIVVNDDELVNRPYVSESTLQKRHQEEEERRRRELENTKDDSKGRALVDMMNGTLEVKRDVFAEASALQRAEWMDSIPLDMMSDVQKKELEEFEEKYKALQEEQSKYKKTLEIELKRQRSDIKEMYKVFDDKVEKLAKLKILTEREILSHELYMSRLALSMATQDQLHKSLKQVDKNVVMAENVLQEKQASIAKFRETVESARETMLRLGEEEKGLVKTFPRDIKARCDENFDPEMIKILTEFFKSRSNGYGGDGTDGMDMTGSEMNTFGFSASGTKRSSSALRSSRSKGAFKRSRNKTKAHTKSRSQQNKSKLGSKMGASKGGTGSRLGPMQEAALAMKEAQEELPSITLSDPFYGIFLRQEREARHLQQMQPSTDFLDIPDDLDFKREYWAHLNELRSAHIQKQIEFSASTTAYNALKKKLDELLVEEVVLTQNVKMLHTTRDEIVKNIEMSDKNLQCVVAIRQGQDEVDKDVVVTDYSDSILIPVHVVNKYNARIKELGHDKIGVLSRIKQFRRKINLLNWEAKHTELEAHHINEYLTDLQLFRVTRNMQQLIREGEDGNTKTVERIDKPTSPKKDVAVVRDSSFRLDKIAKNKQTLKRLLKTRAEENSELQKRIEDLRVQIDDRRKVLESRSDARGEDADPATTAMKRMKKIVTRRRLTDMSSMQSAEIAFLNQELEKMRDKTFPSFVKAFRTRVRPSNDDADQF